jgi:hypothetical protein
LPTGGPDGAPFRIAVADQESPLAERPQCLKTAPGGDVDSTIAAILKQQGIPPSGERPTSWQTFLRAHWNACMAADFFTTEVWTVRGLVTYYTVCVMELHSRCVSIVGSTPHPDEAFMLQVARLSLPKSRLAY